MRKKIIYLMIFILLITFSVLKINNVLADEGHINGELRCQEAAGSKCTEKTEGGKVVETRITEKFDDTYTVTKIVRKKSGSADKFLVSFIVNGPETVEYQEERNANIIVIFDKSGSLTRNSTAYANARKAVVEFGEKFRDQKLSLLVFASNLSEVSFTDSAIKNASVGSSSHIEKAFKKANQILDRAESQENNYVIVFGDGQYWYKDNTCRSSNTCAEGSSSRSCSTTFEKELANLKARDNMKFYAVLYKSTSNERKNCDVEWMQKIASGENFYDARSNNDYKEFFDKIADSIEGHQQQTTITITAKVKDQLGDDFVLTSGSNIIDVKKLNVETEAFEIQLKESAKTESSTLWHPTNSGYTVNIQVSDGTKKDLSSSLSPEVYWEPIPEEISSCSGNVNKNNSESSAVIDKYFKENCEENLTGSVIVNNLALGTKNFNVKSGLGFPAKINLNDNVKCTYTFDETEFKKDYKDYVVKLSDSDERVAAEAAVILQEMNNKLSSFYELTTGSQLNVFKNNQFPNQTATMKVKYFDTSSEDIVDFSMISSSGNVNCSIVRSYNLSDLSGVSRTSISDSVCEFTGLESFELPKVCINIKTYKQESCDSASNLQLLGENKYYVDFDKTGGYVSINVPSFGYFKTDIILDGTKRDINGNYNCSFNISTLPDIIFRQISNSEPFVNNTRGVGRNWLNNDLHYNFVGIIDENIWKEDRVSNYFYKLSKTNVDNIKKNTLDSSSKVKSYLGTDCYINEDNKYICSFTRNSNVDENFFTNATLND